jgi:hypothetical protein
VFTCHREFCRRRILSRARQETSSPHSRATPGRVARDKSPRDPWRSRRHSREETSEALAPSSRADPNGCCLVLRYVLRRSKFQSISICLDLSSRSPCLEG